MSTQKYKCIAHPNIKGATFTIGKEYEVEIKTERVSRFIPQFKI